jgi:hypothetical protein
MSASDNTTMAAVRFHQQTASSAQPVVYNKIANPNDRQVLVIPPSVTGGSYKLSYGGVSTAAIAYNAGPSTIVSALSGIGIPVYAVKWGQGIFGIWGVSGLAYSLMTPITVSAQPTGGTVLVNQVPSTPPSGGITLIGCQVETAGNGGAFTGLILNPSAKDYVGSGTTCAGGGSLLTPLYAGVAAAAGGTGLFSPGVPAAESPVMIGGSPYWSGSPTASGTPTTWTSNNRTSANITSVNLQERAVLTPTAAQTISLLVPYLSDGVMWSAVMAQTAHSVTIVAATVNGQTTTINGSATYTMPATQGATVTFTWDAENSTWRTVQSTP